MPRLGERFSESAAAFRGTFGNPGLRRLQLAGAGSVMGLWAYSVALAVFAFDAGGAKAVGIVALIRTIPSAASAPFTSTLAERLPRIPFMVATNLCRGAAIGAAGIVALAGGSEWIVYCLAGLASILGTAFLPAQSALLPTLARSPEELTAANVVRSTIESVGTFAGPAIGGLLLVFTRPGTVFLVTAATFVWSAVLIGRIRVEAPAGQAPVEKREHAPFLRETTAGFKAIAAEPKLRVVVGLYAAQTMLAGAFSVLVVVTALDLLGRPSSSVGVLNAACGIGGLIGAGIALALVGRKRLASDFGIGILLWGAPFALIGIWPTFWVALVALGLIGIGNTLVDVAGLTLLQRTAPPDVIGRVFGVLEMVLVATIGIGAAVTPILIDAIGIRWTLVVAGALLPALAALCWRRLLVIDAESQAPAELGLLARIPIFSPLPPPSLERLASQLRPLKVAAGATVVRQGDAGDLFYVVETGRLVVTADGVTKAELGPGDFFGEIALLRDVPRTATVAAESETMLWTLGRDVFLEAVAGNPPSARAADAVVGARLATPAAAPS